MKPSVYHFILSMLFLTGGVFVSIKTPNQWVQQSIAPSVLADDDDDDDEKSAGSRSKTKTITTYVKLPDQIIKKQIQTTIYDSDGDGIFDLDDSTPNLNDVFIVKDDNLNGIADAYENEK